MPRTKKKMGRGAVVTILARMLHPRRLIQETFPNMNKNKRLGMLIVLRLEEKKIGKKNFECVVVQSDEVMSGDSHIELYAATKHYRVILEGPSDAYFHNEQEATLDNDIVEVQVQEMLPTAVMERVHLTNFDEEEIAQIRGVVETDNDNDPLPDNIPNPNDNNNNECRFAEQWGHSGTCYRKMEGVLDMNPKLNFSIGTQPSLVDIFDLLFPKQYVIEVMIPEMNNKTELGPIQYGEFLRWLGIWFLIATIQGPSRVEFWRKESIDPFSGTPYRFGEFMSRNRFDDILQSMTYTNIDPPAYLDKFFRIRQLVQEWNENMGLNFKPGWISCLDESMMVWTNEYTCPGFMFVPRKPHPFGNEWHSICCGLSSIMFEVELVEGKDRPTDRGPPEFNHLGKTVGLLLRMTRSMWGSGKVVVLDSGFCVLKGLIELRKKGLFAAALIKKRRYWPKYIQGDAVKQHFEGNNVGDADAWNGKFEDIPFYIHAMKEPDYVMSVMSTYGTLERTGKETERSVNINGQQQRIKFRYPEVFGNHFRYRHMVDDHNNRRHSPISFEESWATKSWENRVFAFLVAVTEVNIMLATKYFYGNDISSQLAFRKQFSKELIFNKYIQQEVVSGLRRSKRKSIICEHELLTIPRGKKFLVDKIISANMTYQQFKCSGCTKRIRTFCKCSPGIFLCKECYVNHCRDADIMVQTPVTNSVSRSLRFTPTQS
jgi:Transposase IS4